MLQCLSTFVRNCSIILQLQSLNVIHSVAYTYFNMVDIYPWLVSIHDVRDDVTMQRSVLHALHGDVISSERYGLFKMFIICTREFVSG